MKINDLTVLVPTKNEQKNIQQFLGSIPETVKLVIVDDSDDKTVEIILKTRPQNTEIIKKKGNVSVARQTGVEAAKTEWLLFTDADVHFDKNYFAELERFDPKYAFFGTKLSNSKHLAYYNAFAKTQNTFYEMGIPAVTGSNMGVRKECILKAGGFDQSMPVNEDTEMSFRLNKYGYTFEFYPDLKVYAHDHRRVEKGVVTKLFHSFVRSALLYLNVMPEEWKKQDWGYWK